MTFSAFELYEWHSTQEGTRTKPGDTLSLDLSMVRTIVSASSPRRLQLGVAAYLQRQMSAKTGPSITADQSRERYAVNALGLVANVVFPTPRTSFGLKLFQELSNRASYQGYSIQVSGSWGF